MKSGNTSGIFSKWLPSKVSLKNLGQLTAGNVVVLLFTIISYPILSRLYSDEQFGELAVFQSSIIIIAQLSTLNYEEAFVIIKSRSRFSALLTSSLTLNFIVAASILLLIILLWFLGFIPDIFLLFYAVLLVFTIIFRGNMQIGKYSFIRNEQYSKVSVLKVLDRSVFQVAAMGSGIFRFSTNWLIISYSFANLVAGAYALFDTRRFLKFFQSLKFKIDTLRHYEDFPKYAMPSIFLDQLSRQLPVYFITYILSTELTGQFSLAYRVLSIPEMVLGASVGQLFYKNLSEKYQSGEPIKETLVKIWGVLFIIGLIPFGVVFFFGEELFSWVFGTQWNMSGQMASYLSPMLLIMFISTPTSFIFTVFRNQKKSLVINIFVLIVRTLVLYFGLYYLPIIYAILLLACAEIGLIVIYNIVAWHLIKKVKP